MTTSTEKVEWEIEDRSDGWGGKLITKPDETAEGIRINYPSERFKLFKLTSTTTTVKEEVV